MKRVFHTFSLEYLNYSPAMVEIIFNSSFMFACGNVSKILLFSAIDFLFHKERNCEVFKQAKYIHSSHIIFIQYIFDDSK